MDIMTFEEWRSKNRDLEEELREDFHPSGVTWGVLADMGVDGASWRIEDELRIAYRAQRELDERKLKLWDEAVQSCDLGQ